MGPTQALNLEVRATALALAPLKGSLDCSVHYTLKFLEKLQETNYHSAINRHGTIPSTAQPKQHERLQLLVPGASRSLSMWIAGE